MNQRQGASSVACVCYYSNIASTTWNRGLNTVRPAVGIKRAHKVRELQSVWIPPEEKPEAEKERPSQIEGAM